MTIALGYFDVARTGRPPTPVAGCLDNDGADEAFAADEVWLRAYEDKRRPDPAAYAERAVAFARARRRPGAAGAPCPR